jgi:hypothetical protein
MVDKSLATAVQGMVGLYERGWKRPGFCRGKGLLVLKGAILKIFFKCSQWSQWCGGQGLVRD